MNEEKLVWRETGRKKVFDCRVFSVWESTCIAPDASAAGADQRTYTIIKAIDWAVIIPVIETPQGKQFVMVRQWRHGSQSLSLEFPGGVFEPGENPEEAAARELLEETGYRSGTIRKLGEFSPNPALMTNRTHFFLAEDLTDTGKQALDEDEYVAVVLADAGEVCKNMGKPPYIHALMGSALSLYYQGLYVLPESHIP